MSMIIAALTMKRDRVKREKLRKDLGGRGAPKAAFAGEIDDTLCFVAIVLLCVQMAS